MPTTLEEQEPPSSSTPSSSNWLQSLLKMRRFFLYSKKPTKKQPLHCSSSNDDNNDITTNDKLINIKSLSELFELQQEEEVLETEEIIICGHNNNKREKCQEVMLQRAVKELLFGSNEEERDSATKAVSYLAAIGDVETRKSLGELGVIPPLVSMVPSNVVSRRCLALQALTHLADATFTNKALTLEAGILSKLPTDIDNLDEQTSHDLSKLLLSISALSNNTHFPFNPSTLHPFILATIQSKSTSEKTKEACLGTLYNLSAVLDNAGSLISNRVVDILLSALSSSSEKVSELALATLGNLVVTLMGKKSLEENSMVAESLIDSLTWEDRPKCQELSAYVLMILAHQSSKQRAKMAKAGIVHVLLEVALLGSPLAQKRALKLLQWFKDERHVKVGPHSGPQTTRQLSMGSPVHDNSEGKRLMKKMVQQSLHKNMEVITRRANVHASGESSKFKALVISSSSKSLPY